MVSQIVNNQSLKKYEEFVHALDMALFAIEDCDAIISVMADGKVSIPGFKVPSKAEVMAARKSAVSTLGKLRKDAQKYEKELIAKTWRV